MPGGSSPLSAAAQQLPPHVGQHVADLVEQLVRLVEPARGFGAAARLAVPSCHSAMRASMRVMSGTEVTGSPSASPPISTIRRTGRLLAPSMPVSSSALPAQPAAAVVAHAGEDVAQHPVPPSWRAPR